MQVILRISAADPETLELVLNWMEAVIEEPIDREQTPHKVLKDGVIICKVMNKLEPGCIKKIITKGQNFQLMENHNGIIRSMKNFGVPAEEIYQIPDLFEGRNMKSAFKSLYALGRTATNKGWDGPHLGPTMAKPQKRNFTEEQNRQGRDATIGLQAGQNQGATAAGINMGKGRSVLD